MTLEGATKHLNETLGDPNHDWGCKSCEEDHRQLLEWLLELQSIRARAEAEEKSPCALCEYGGKHIDAPPCTTCPAHPKEVEKNEPLTLDELREMDGQPVWVDRPSGYKYYNGWALVDVAWKANNVIYLVSTHGPAILCEELLNSGGNVYRRRPKEEAK